MECGSISLVVLRAAFVVPAALSAALVAAGPLPAHFIILDLLISRLVVLAH